MTTAILRFALRVPLCRRVLDAFFGLPLSVRLRELDLPEGYEAEVVAECLAGRVGAMLGPHRKLSRQLSESCERRDAGFIYVAYTMYPDVISEAIELDRRYPGGGVLVTMRESLMAKEQALERFAMVLPLENNLFLLFFVLHRMPYGFAALRYNESLVQSVSLFLAAVRTRFLYRPAGFMNQREERYLERAEPHLYARLERLLLERASLVVHFNRQDAVDDLALQLGAGRIRQLPIWPGPHDDLVAGIQVDEYLPSERIRVAWLGGLRSPELGEEDYGYWDIFYDDWKRLTAAGIEVHVYVSHRSAEDPFLQPILMLFEGDRYFRLHSAIPFLELYRSLSQIDFTWGYFNSPMFAYRPMFRAFVSSHDCLSLRAGVPLIVNENYEGLCETVSRLEVGIVHPFAERERLPDALKAADLARLRANCRQHAFRFGFPAADFLAALPYASHSASPNEREERAF